MKKELFVAGLIAVVIFAGCLFGGVLTAEAGMWSPSCKDNNARIEALATQLKGHNETLIMLNSSDPTPRQEEYIENLESQIPRIEDEIACLSQLDGGAEHEPCLSNGYVDLGS